MRDSGKKDPATDQLLDWYDRHARTLPWRVSPAQRRGGKRPDPYRVWLSEIMLQQTTVAAVKDYYLRFTQIWPTVFDLASAPDDQVMAAWAGLGYYARARNLLKCARSVVADHQGVFPDTRAALERLPGIGPYTSAAIAAIAFDQPETVVDGNVERVMARRYGVQIPLPTAKPELVHLAAQLTPAQRPGCYAQAVMDLGATVCTPKTPACGICPWISDCTAFQRGDAAELPRKLPKARKPLRKGIAYLAQTQDGEWLVERRPESGLLGGMLGWPGPPWGAHTDTTPPFAAAWRDPGGQVRHTFTHFHLHLDLRVARDVTQPENSPLIAIPEAEFRANDLPTVMRKAFKLAHPWFGSIETEPRQD